MWCSLFGVAKCQKISITVPLVVVMIVVTTPRLKILSSEFDCHMQLRNFKKIVFITNLFVELKGLFPKAVKYIFWKNDTFPIMWTNGLNSFWK